MKTRRTLAVLAVLFACGMSMFAQNLNRSVDFGGITIYYPDTYRIDMQERGKDSDFIYFVKSGDDVFASAGFTITQHDVILRVPKEKKMEALNDFLQRGRATLTKDGYTNVHWGDVEIGKYGELSVSQTYTGTLEGFDLTGENINFIQGSTFVAITLQSYGTANLREMQTMVRAIKCP